MGGDFPIFKKEVRARFDKVDVVRPKATREHSYEVLRGGAGLQARLQAAESLAQR